MTHIDIFLILLFGVIILVISFAFSMLSELTGINHFFSWAKVQLISFAVRCKTTKSEKERQAIQETVEEQKNATYKIVIMMDDDDIYQPNYVKNSIDTMIEKKVKCVGSNQMIFYQ